jgi:hypothetical protein
VVSLELVIALPVLLMLIIGTVVLGSFLSVKAQTVGDARDGARRAALGLSLPAGTWVSAGECNPPVAPDDWIEVTAERSVTLRSFPLVPVDFLPATVTEPVRMRCGA